MTTVLPRASTFENAETPSDATGGFLEHLTGIFANESAAANTRLQEALAALTKNPSDPALLAKYQSCLSQYTLYRNAQSSVVKSYKDVGAGIIANYR